jgi:hypothetical protein
MPAGVSVWRVVRLKKKHEPDRKVGAHRTAEPKFRQPVVRTVRESIFLVHCYLGCGHMVTTHHEDLEEPSPSSIECWACKEEAKKKG